MQEWQYELVANPTGCGLDRNQGRKIEHPETERAIREFDRVGDQFAVPATVVEAAQEVERTSRSASSRDSRSACFGCSGTAGSSQHAGRTGRGAQALAQGER